VLFSTVLSELVYIRPTVCISYTAMRVVLRVTVLFILYPWYDNLFSGPGKVLVLVLVLKEKVLVLVLTKKSYLHHWLHITTFIIINCHKRTSVTQLDIYQMQRSSASS